MKPTLLFDKRWCSHGILIYIKFEWLTWNIHFTLFLEINTASASMNVVKMTVYKPIMITKEQISRVGRAHLFLLASHTPPDPTHPSDQHTSIQHLWCHLAYYLPLSSSTSLDNSSHTGMILQNMRSTLNFQTFMFTQWYCSLCFGC